MKQSIISMLLLILFSLTAGAQDPDNDPLSMGQRALANNELDAARSFLEKAYKSDSQDTVAILNLAEVCIRLQDGRRAEQVLDAGIKLYPELPMLYLKRGIALNLRGRFRNAQESFMRAHELLNPDDPVRSILYVNLGLAILNDNRPLDALSWFDKALLITPRNATAYNYKGSSLYLMGEFADAVESLNMAIDIDDKNPISFYNRGMAYLKSGEQSKACLDFHAACKMGNMNACKVIMMECAQKQ